MATMHIWLPTIRTGTGTDIFSLRLCKAIQSRGLYCTLSWYRHHFELFPLLLSKVAAPAGINMVHSNSWNAFTFRRKDIPLIVTEHLNVHDQEYRKYKSTMQSIYHNTLIKNYEHRSFQIADKITCVSHYTRKSILESFPLREVDVIPTWVDTELFSPCQGVVPTSKRFRLLFSGNLTRRKGWDIVPAIMGELGPDFELYYTGSIANDRAYMLPSNMVAAGRIDSPVKMRALYNSCDAILFPSRLEGLSQSVLEAMSCGRPVVASNCSSMPELIDHGKNGFLCEKDQVEDFVRAIRKLARNREMLREFSDNARSKIRNNFSEDVVIPKYILMYESVYKR